MTPDFEQEVYAEVMDYRTLTEDPRIFIFAPEPPKSVGTPGHAVTIAQLRHDPRAGGADPQEHPKLS